MSPAEMIRAAEEGAAQRIAPHMDAAILGLYHGHQEHAWTKNVLDSVEAVLAEAGVHSRLQEVPAICFLDITGYTQLTEEQGDEAAAELAETVGGIVRRVSTSHGGKPTKWLGDGVMLYYPEPGPGVLAALEIREELVWAGLPPAHVGLHVGPVLFQEGDYYGQTVNLASRIADHAGPGEVVVSRAVVDAAGSVPVTFTEMGLVELKGIAGTVRLYAAGREG
jgi:adenylate cyclase